jgi:hypothetical protein
MTAERWCMVQVGLFSLANPASAERASFVTADCNSLCCHVRSRFRGFEFELHTYASETVAFLAIVENKGLGL